MPGTVKVNGHSLDWEDGMTVDDILKKMRYTFKMLFVKVNGELVGRDQYASFNVPDGAEVKVIHLMSGG